VPDIVVFAWERIPLDDNGDANIFGAAPDWTIKILSQTRARPKLPGISCIVSNTVAV